jgi:large subunit ribosomal protein L9
MTVQVILLERIESLGQMGDVVSVRPGYARNYLIPKKKALRATSENKAYFDSQRLQIQATQLEKKGEAQKVFEKINGLELTVVRSASEMGHLYGAIRAKDLLEILESRGFFVRKDQIQIGTPIKSLGIHTVFVVLHPEVKASLQIRVAQSLEEAQVAHQAENENEEEIVIEEDSAQNPS